MVYCDTYLMKIQIFDAEYLQLQLYCWLLYWSSHNQTKLKKRIYPLFLSWKKIFIFLSSSSSTRHIIYHYEINDKFFDILRHVYYFRWIIIQLNISTCLIFILSITYEFCISLQYLFSLSIYLLYSVIFTENLYHSQMYNFHRCSINKLHSALISFSLFISS